MGGSRAERIEAVVDASAAAVFAAGAGTASFALMNGVHGEPRRAAFSAAAAAIAGLLSASGLRRVAAEDRRFAVPEFELPAVEQFEPDELLLTDEVELLLTDSVELVLTDADRLRPAQAHAPEELMLDDILAELGPNSRVVRLFDPAAMPTPGQLNARIERHLGEGTSPLAPPDASAPDASQALYDALAELRRSLR